MSDWEMAATIDELMSRVDAGGVLLTYGQRALVHEIRALRVERDAALADARALRQVALDALDRIGVLDHDGKIEDGKTREEAEARAEELRNHERHSRN